jgi:hypothetical protein
MPKIHWQCCGIRPNIILPDGRIQVHFQEQFESIKADFMLNARILSDLYVRFDNGRHSATAVPQSVLLYLTCICLAAVEHYLYWAMNNC